MTVPVTPADLAVSFRDRDVPRPLATRPIAVAHRHQRGWTVLVTADRSEIYALTFDAVPSAVRAVTGVRNLLIIWPGGAAS
ncbi:hypothetical protein [Paractinoplanes brasiliensis]|uniref:Uncharacterized protein n=1 Tax=Paractinoplanes brasiliensis TaxID=52695 RepID=A0A4R6JZZ2_9ACTN|nr:hypothetical protein [Actinoplanes brasiliensis]TDO41361.1 hypothetical protein C8E87_5093 [Actinoplanes brasiliensis]GID27356.1 hypothetical protein Abr02nite_23390 [Actinoplanes brasiliensis]